MCRTLPRLRAESFSIFEWPVGIFLRRLVVAGNAMTGEFREREDECDAEGLVEATC